MEIHNPAASAPNKGAARALKRALMNGSSDTVKQPVRQGNGEASGGDQGVDKVVDKSAGQVLDTGTDESVNQIVDKERVDQGVDKATGESEDLGVGKGADKQKGEFSYLFDSDSEGENGGPTSTHTGARRHGSMGATGSEIVMIAGADQYSAKKLPSDLSTLTVSSLLYHELLCRSCVVCFYIFVLVSSIIRPVNIVPNFGKKVSPPIPNVYSLSKSTPNFFLTILIFQCHCRTLLYIINKIN